ncbi:MAG: hypothetical protein WA691_00175 [Thermoplasmata archaeon]
MAKKARRKLEEEEEQAFEFPPFDEGSFTKKEFEIGQGVLLVGMITLAIGFASWLLYLVGLSVWVALALGIVVLIVSPFVIRRIRPLSSLYTKGDWAGLLAMEFFGWFALWFLLINLAPNAI